MLSFSNKILLLIPILLFNQGFTHTSLQQNNKNINESFDTVSDFCYNSDQFSCYELETDSEQLFDLSTIAEDDYDYKDLDNIEHLLEGQHDYYTVAELYDDPSTLSHLHYSISYVDMQAAAYGLFFMSATVGSFPLIGPKFFPLTTNKAMNLVLFITKKIGTQPTIASLLLLGAITGVSLGILTNKLGYFLASH